MKNDHTGAMIWSADGVEFFAVRAVVDRQAEGVERDGCLQGVAPAADMRNHDEFAGILLGRVAVVPSRLAAGQAGAQQHLAVREEQRPGAVELLVADKSRACQLMWNGAARNSTDRTHWGRAVLRK